jgi:hypothetical protein
MTRKDYILIAATLKSAMPDADYCGGESSTAYGFAKHYWVKACQAMAYQLAGQNSAFDRARFLAACGV